MSKAEGGSWPMACAGEYAQQVRSADKVLSNAWNALNAVDCEIFFLFCLESANESQLTAIFVSSLTPDLPILHHTLTTAQPGPSSTVLQPPSERTPSVYQTALSRIRTLHKRKHRLLRKSSIEFTQQVPCLVNPTTYFCRYVIAPFPSCQDFQCCR